MFMEGGHEIAIERTPCLLMPRRLFNMFVRMVSWNRFFC